VAEQACLVKKVVQLELSSNWPPIVPATLPETLVQSVQFEVEGVPSALTPVQMSRPAEPGDVPVASEKIVLVRVPLVSPVQLGAITVPVASART